jgi:hypothetical protein
MDKLQLARIQVLAKLRDRFTVKTMESKTDTAIENPLALQKNDSDGSDGYGKTKQKRGRNGRFLTKGTAGAVEARTVLRPNQPVRFPKPRYGKVQDNSSAKKSHLFFRYWRGLGPEFVPCCRVKVYRVWPDCDFKLANPNLKDVSVDIFRRRDPF